MAKTSGLGDRLFVGGYDLSGDVGSIQKISGPHALLDVTGLDKSAPERLTGHRDGSMQFNSWFNDAAAQEHAALRTLPTADVVVMYCRGVVLGNDGAGMVAKQINYDGQRQADGSLAFSVDLQANGFGLEWIDQLTAGTRDDTTPTNGPSIDGQATQGLIGASSAFGMAAYLQVFGINGSSIVVHVQDSADNSTFADITGLVFPAVTVNAPAGSRIETGLTATIRRYLRVITTGSFIDFRYAVGVTRYLTARDP